MIDPNQGRGVERFHMIVGRIRKHKSRPGYPLPFSALAFHIFLGLCGLFYG